MSLKKICPYSLLMIFLFVMTIISPSGQARDTKYIQYDFSNPGKVFKTTINETVVKKGINPSILFQILKVGQIVIVNDHPNNPDIPWLSTAGILVNAPAEHVMQVLCDYKNYHRMIPQVDNADSKKVTDSIDQIFYKLNIKLLFFKMKVPYSVYHYYRPPYRIDWVLAGGKFNINIGAYEVVTPPGRPDCCLLFYTSFVQPRNAILMKLYKRFLSLDKQINLSLGILWVKAIGDYAERIYQQKAVGIAPPEQEELSLPELIRNHPETLMALSRQGKVIILENTSPRYYTAGIMINKSVEETYRAVSDFSGSCSLNDRHTMTVLSRGENQAEVEVKLVLNVIFDFDTKYIVHYQMSPPFRIDWKEAPGQRYKGVAGSWDFIPAGENVTFTVYRNTSDLRRFGFLLRQLLKIDPAFELAIQACSTQMLISDTKKWAEMTPEEKKQSLTTKGTKRG